MYEPMGPSYSNCRKEERVYLICMSISNQAMPGSSRNRTRDHGRMLLTGLPSWLAFLGLGSLLSHTTQDQPPKGGADHSVLVPPASIAQQMMEAFPQLRFSSQTTCVRVTLTESTQCTSTCNPGAAHCTHYNCKVIILPYV